MCPGDLLFRPSFLTNHAEREGKVDGVQLANLFSEEVHVVEAIVVGNETPSFPLLRGKTCLSGVWSSP